MELVLVSLRLHNYRTYKDLDIKFDIWTEFEPKDLERPIDIGKTNILRALKTLLYHDEFPEAAVTYGQSFAFIEGTFSNGSIIRREWRKGGKQRTIITYPDGSTVTKDGVKAAALFVKSIIGINPVVLDTASGEEDFNFIPAGAAVPFLNDRQDTLLRKMSALIGSNQLEEAAIGLAKEIRSLETEKRVKDKEVALKKELREKKVKVLESIKDFDTKMMFLDNKIQDKNSLLELLRRIDKVFNDTSIEKVRSVAHSGEGLLLKVSTKSAQLKELLTAQQNLALANQNIQQAKDSLKDTETELKANQELFEKAKAELIICDGCGRPI